MTLRRLHRLILDSEQGTPDPRSILISWNGHEDQPQDRDVLVELSNPGSRDELEITLSLTFDEVIELVAALRAAIGETSEDDERVLNKLQRIDAIKGERQGASG